MIPVTFRPLGQWQGPRIRRQSGTFRSSQSDTMDLLNSELVKLGATSVVIQIDVGEDDIRLDGWPRANARPDHPGVAISFESKHGPLRYATDQYHYWQHNLRAIALGLQALRAVDRYGITQSGEQYTGWRQLGSGSGPTSEEEALHTIRLYADPGWAERPLGKLIREALRNTHPDHGGDPEAFAKVQAARRFF